MVNLTVAQYNWQGTDYQSIFVDTFPRGQVIEFTNLEEFCHSALLFSSFAQYDWKFLGAIYMLLLIWMFIGIALISDIFMEGIEHITA